MRRLAKLGLAAGMAMALCVPASAQRVSDGHRFLEAVRERDGTVATEMLNEPGSTVVNSRDISNGETALHVAAARRDTAWLRFLTQRGADPNISNKWGVTPLQVSVSLGDVDGAEALLKAGASQSHGNATGETPLITAVHRRDMPMIRLLLENGANIDMTDSSGRSARDYALLQGERSPIVEALDRAEEERAKKPAAQDYGPRL